MPHKSSENIIIILWIQVSLETLPMWPNEGDSHLGGGIKWENQCRSPRKTLVMVEFANNSVAI